MKKEVFEQLNRKYLEVENFYLNQKKTFSELESIDEKIQNLSQIKDVGTKQKADFNEKIEKLKNATSELLNIIQVVKGEQNKYDEEIEKLVIGNNENKQKEVSNDKENQDKRLKLAVEEAIIKEKRNFQKKHDLEIERLKKTYSQSKEILNLLKQAESFFEVNKSVEENNEQVIEYLEEMKKENEKLYEEIRVLKEFYIQFKNLEVDVEA